MHAQASLEAEQSPDFTRSSGSEGLLKFVAHSHRAASIAVRLGWLPGARYTNLRDARAFDRLGFLDIDWKSYDFARHLEAARRTRPMLTVARDLEDVGEINRTLDEAFQLEAYAEKVIIVPKDPLLEDCMEAVIPPQFLLGYSVPTRYGGTSLPLSSFRRPVHLLGGRPDEQRRLGASLSVASLDCNRFTLDARFGDYFDGQRFRPHPRGGYDLCIEESIRNINRIWLDY